ncbi:MAG: sulfotransferase family protein [Acidimicrobiales bacterium]
MTTVAPEIRCCDGDPRRAYVVGCYRSGTTLVERIVGCHPDSAGLGFETHFFTHVVPGRPLPGFNAREWEQPLRQQLGVRSWEHVAGDRWDVFDSIAKRLAKERGASVFVEKTPFHLFHVERILARDPDARVVHVVRDGRDVVTSVLAGQYPLGKWPTRRLRLLAACALWELFTWEGLRLAQLESERFHTLRYEDVVRAPRTALETLARFLELDDSDAALDAWFDRTRRIGSNSSFQSMRGICDQAVSRWREPNKLRPDEAELVAGLLAPTLALAGYETSGARVAPRLRAGISHMGKLMLALTRMAQFRGNTGAAPPLHLWRYPQQSARRRPPVGAGGSSEV